MEPSKNDIQRSWGWFLALGVLMISGGVSALFAPIVFSVFVEQLVGFVFIAGSIVMLAQVFTTSDGWDARLIYLTLGVFNALAGIALLLRPLEGILALTLVLIVAVFVGGLMRIAVGVMARPEAGSGWVIAGGILSVFVSIYLMMNYPEIGAVLLGIMAGVSLIGEGAGYLRFAYGLRNNVSVAI